MQVAAKKRASSFKGRAIAAWDDLRRCRPVLVAAVALVLWVLIALHYRPGSFLMSALVRFRLRSALLPLHRDLWGREGCIRRE
jgi:hypothetical protein